MEVSDMLATDAGNLVRASIDSGFLPIKPCRSRGTVELDFHASGFVVGIEGVWTNADIAQFRHFLNLRHIDPWDAELDKSLARAKEKYLQGKNSLFLCKAHPCCKACSFDTSEKALAVASRMAGLPIFTTGCQGQCKQAPVLSLRIGDRSQMFARVVAGKDWLTVLAFAKEAAQADSLLVNPGDAESFLYDPAHKDAKPDAHLKGLRFLLGRFRGEGRCAMGSQVFQKEVVGTVEAGGRFIALRMAASYPLTNGRKDTHRALVVVGIKLSSKCIIGRAYNDGGRTCEYEVEQNGDILQFADALPDHGRQWKRARKILKPTKDGYEESLEVDAGAGFINYYKIAMRKISSL
jgi:hypothetical protein